MRSVPWAWMYWHRARDMDRMVSEGLRVAEAPPGEYEARIAQRLARRKRYYQQEQARKRGAHEQS